MALNCIKLSLLQKWLYKLSKTIKLQKFVELADHAGWKRLNDYIVRVYGEKDRPADQPILTPTEMLR
jgi:hypothetical protein